MGTTRGTTGRTTERSRPARREPAGSATSPAARAAGGGARPSGTRPPNGGAAQGQPQGVRGKGAGATRSVSRPAGPRPPGRRPRPSRAVIWRRRIVALLVLLALVAGLVWGVSALVRTLTARGAEADTVTAQDSEDSAASSAGAAGQEEPTGPVDPGKCSPRDLDVRLSATPGQPTSFAVTLTNRAEVACLLDAGAASLVLTVHSGEDRVWSSGDCVAEPAARELLLDAGDSTETAIRWDGTRSARGCPGGQGAAQPGSYRVSATLGGASLPAADTSFTL